MDKAELQAIRARADAATEGPWTGIERGNSVVSRGVATVAYDGQPRKNVCSGISPKSSDAAFIAAARTDVPALCDEVERLQDAQRWVDAEYDTPDIGRLVLLYLPDKETDKIRAGEYLGEGDYRIGQKLYRGMEISAWMPLPAPPKGE